MLLFVFFFFIFRFLSYVLGRHSYSFLVWSADPLLAPFFTFSFILLGLLLLRILPLLTLFLFGGLRFFQVLWAFNSDSRLFQYHHSVDSGGFPQNKRGTDLPFSVTRSVTRGPALGETLADGLKVR